MSVFGHKIRLARTPLSGASVAGPSPSAPARLSLTGVRKSLGAANVVNGIDLTVNAGESVVLLGPSGCGKTTTLRMVAGFMDPDAGEIHLAGRLAAGGGVSMPTEHRRLGMVFQTYAVWPHKTVFGNVAYGLSINGNDRATIHAKVEAALDLVQLSGLGDRFPADLSGGQQQRVALARAMVVEPSLLLLDEPLSNLDASLRQDMRLELKRLHQRTGMTTLYVTHDQEEALVLADRIAVMNLGRIEQLDTPEAIYRRPQSRFVASFVGSSTIIEATVVQIDAVAGRILAATALGAPFWTNAGENLIAAASIGAAIAVVLRPEDIVLVRPGSGGYRATLCDAVFLGSRYEVTVNVSGQQFIAHTRTLDMLQDGTADLVIAPDAAWAVP
jgi:ABC-type Fe3+/spermidine/putrescine transport system ATPase subunit